MKNRILFGNYGEGRTLTEGMGGGDEVGELREEEIVWGEAEISHQSKEADNGMMEKPVAEMVGGRNHRATTAGRQRSMLSRQMELMEARTWVAGDRMSISMESMNYSRKEQEHEDTGGGGGVEQAGVTAHRPMDKLIPPHELLARQYAASASFSVVHGAGRTLKGMDLRRLRNEVWRQTGFMD